MTEEKEMTFSNLLAVTNYLIASGWKIKKSALYGHNRQGKIRPQKDGRYRIKDVDKYANTWLRRIETGLKVSTTQENMQERRLKAETEKMEAQARLYSKKADVVDGAFMEKTQFEHALAQRAAFLKTDIEAFIRNQTPKIIGLCEGKSNKASDLVLYMLDELAKWMNRYAEDKTFAVPQLSANNIFTEDEEEDDGDEDENEENEDDDDQEDKKRKKPKKQQRNNKK